MNQEVEVQVIIKKPVEVERTLRKVGCYIKTRKQVDKYFVPPHNNFFSENPINEYLRIRYEKGGDHLSYSLVRRDKNGQKMSTDEYETLVEDPKIVEEIFTKVGLIHKLTVTKTRKYFNCGDFEVTLDQVNQLGDFMEVEAKKDLGGIKKTKQACWDFIKKLGVEYEFRTVMGYARMLYRKLQNNKQ